MTAFALSIAASDPSGGAGIEEDIKVFSALSVFGMSAITGITVQGPKGIENIIPTPENALKRVLEIMKNDIKPDAVKIGALVNKKNLILIRDFLKKTRIKSVLDTILNSSTGYPLLEKSAWKDLQLLFPLVDLITPNIPEAEILSGIKIKNPEDLLKAGKILMQKGAKAILLKGGHLESTPEDSLFLNGKIRKFRKKRIKARFHGLGCALSSAIAGYLSLGASLEESVERAELYIKDAMASSVEISGVKYLSHI